MSSRLNDFTDQVHQSEQGRGARARILDGPLDEYAVVLEDRGWVVARLEPRAGQGLRELIVDALQLPVADLVRPNAPSRMAAATEALQRFARPVLDARSTGTCPPGEDPHLEDDLHELLLTLVKAAAAEGVGIALLIEKANDLSTTSLGAIFTLTAGAQTASWPLHVILSGLRT